MPKRELRIVRDETVVGAVVVDGDTAQFEGQARDVFARMCHQLGDHAAAQRLITDGWSNGYLYLAP